MMFTQRKKYYFRTCTLAQKNHSVIKPCKGFFFFFLTTHNRFYILLLLYTSCFDRLRVKKKVTILVFYYIFVVNAYIVGIPCNWK
jgi:hypothetical protein